MLVKATRRGHIYGITRSPGEQFECAFADLALISHYAQPQVEDPDAEVLVEQAARRVTECEAVLANARARHAELMRQVSQ